MELDGEIVILEAREGIGIPPGAPIRCKIEMRQI
ncbi:hypothetical protein [Paenibacillus amylolyticus]